MNKEKPKEKKYFEVKAEIIVPAIITYRVLAEDEEDALEQIKKIPPNGFKPNLSLKKMIKAIVYNSGSTMIKLVKHFKK
jgi:hypothetical protein